MIRKRQFQEVLGHYQPLGFEVVEAHTINADTSRYQVKSLKQRLIDTVEIPFYAVPHFRGRLLVVGKKPAACR